MIDFISEGVEEYNKAYKLGKKEIISLPALDDILKEKNIKAPKEVPLGLIKIPLDQIVGTKTAGRSAAFTKNFYPTLKDGTEFAAKWVSLYAAHVQEGIRDPLKVYEFLNKFYVEEGNKRVSVLKWCGADSFQANVIRVIPPRSDDKEIKLYYEFLDFYNVSEINYIWFSQEGSFAKLQRYMGKRPDEHWSDDDKMNFRSTFNRFSIEYDALGGNKLPILRGDAFLSFISVYDYASLEDMSNTELKKKIIKMWDEFKLLNTNQSSVELKMDPSTDPEKKMNIFSKILPLSSQKLKVAFIHEKTAKTSGWTYAHDLGRLHLEETFPDQLVTTCYENATVQNITSLLEQAIADGNTIIFTTSPPLLKASVKAAIEHPDIKILNCSIHNTSRAVRTYYARMYEAKFLMGAIAGSLAENGKIGYIADYPIMGMIANINAFAFGAKMVNPRAKIYLEWSTLKNSNPEKTFQENDIHYISGRDMIIPGEGTRHFGLYHSEENTPLNLAMPIWHWGKFYEKMLRKIIDGTWKNEDTSDKSKGLNYWWGMSSGMIDVIHSKHLPIGTARLIYVLKQTITSGNYNPFSGVLYSQEGLVQKRWHDTMTPEQIITMDWLAENIVGYIPKMEDLVDNALPVVLLQGIDTPE